MQGGICLKWFSLLQVALEFIVYRCIFYSNAIFQGYCVTMLVCNDIVVRYVMGHKVERKIWRKVRTSSVSFGRFAFADSCVDTYFSPFNDDGWKKIRDQLFYYSRGSMIFLWTAHKILNNWRQTSTISVIP